jgi:hypothetical protein
MPAFKQRQVGSSPNVKRINTYWKSVTGSDHEPAAVTV